MLPLPRQMHILPLDLAARMLIRVPVIILIGTVDITPIGIMAITQIVTIQTIIGITRGIGTHVITILIIMVRIAVNQIPQQVV